MTVRRFELQDAVEVSELIALTLCTTNSRDYSAGYLDELIQHMGPDDIIKRADGQHFYVVREADRIIGCGSIGPYGGREDESCFYSIFVHPHCQGIGIGRMIIDTLEQDEFFLRAKRVEVPASVTALPFYMKMGYGYKNGNKEPDDEQLVRLEKYRL